WERPSELPRRLNEAAEAAQSGQGHFFSSFRDCSKESGPDCPYARQKHEKVRVEYAGQKGHPRLGEAESLALLLSEKTRQKPSSDRTCYPLSLLQSLQDGVYSPGQQADLLER